MNSTPTATATATLELRLDTSDDVTIDADARLLSQAQVIRDVRRQGKGNTDPFLPRQPVDAKMIALPRRVEPRVLSCGLVRRPTEFGMFRR